MKHYTEKRKNDEKHAQTNSDIVDCRLGGHVEHSLDGTEHPVGLKSN